MSHLPTAMTSLKSIFDGWRGRVTWFARMSAPGSAAVAGQISVWERDTDGNRDVVENALAIADHADELERWLEPTWGMIDATLTAWHMAILSRTYRHTWNGETYAVSRQ